MEAAAASSISNTDLTGDRSLSVTAAGDLNPPLAPFRERLGWALYDFPNTVFSMNIARLYFAPWLVAGLGPSKTLFSIWNGITLSLVVGFIPGFVAIYVAT